MTTTTTPALPSPSDHAEMPKRMVGRRLVRTCSCGKPYPCEQGRWNRLRDHIREERRHAGEVGDGHAELGHRDESERAYGAVDALDRLLAAMERLEAD